jgi:hypothetical protein
MIAVFFRREKAVIEATVSLARLHAYNHRRSRRWSFYTASALASSNSVREVGVRLRLRSYGRDAVRSAGDWHARVEECVCKDMAAIAVRSAV